MIDIISIIAYFFFFFGCLYFCQIKNKNVIKAFVFFLFLFLCFGYMTGSDWVTYEPSYSQTSYLLSSATTEKGFWYLFNFMSRIVPDYFLMVGILKCIYLYSIIHFLRNITNNWLLVLGLAFTDILLFMIVDNPLRFMVANIFINFGLKYIIVGNYKKFLLISGWAVLFHATSVLLILIIILGRIKLFFEKINKHLLFALFLVITVAVSEVSLIQNVYEYVNANMILYLNTGDYRSYMTESNESLFTVGSALKVFFAGWIIYNRDSILKGQYGSIVFNYSILYLLLSRLLMIVPTGFRLVIPIEILYFIAISLTIVGKKALLRQWGVVLMMSIILFKTLYSSYVYVPYSNSIPYILTNHIPYSERIHHNVDAYYDRVGQQVGN